MTSSISIYINYARISPWCLLRIIKQSDLSYWLVLISPVCKQVNPCHLSLVSSKLFSVESTVLHTATVPKMAPLAPTEGAPTSEKLPPSTLLAILHQSWTIGSNLQVPYPKMPAAKYNIRNDTEPISFSTCLRSWDGRQLPCEFYVLERKTLTAPSYSAHNEWYPHEGIQVWWI